MEVQLWAGTKYYFLQRVQATTVTHQTFCGMGTWVFSPSVKGDRSPSLVPRLRKHWAIPPGPYICPYGVVLRWTKRQHNCEFFFLEFDALFFQYEANLSYNQFWEGLALSHCTVETTLFCNWYSSNTVHIFIPSYMLQPCRPPWGRMNNYSGYYWSTEHLYPEFNWPVTYFIFFSHGNSFVSVIIS